MLGQKTLAGSRLSPGSGTPDYAKSRGGGAPPSLALPRAAEQRRLARRVQRRPVDRALVSRRARPGIDEVRVLPRLLSPLIDRGTFARGRRSSGATRSVSAKTYDLVEGRAVMFLVPRPASNSPGGPPLVQPECGGDHDASVRSADVETDSAIPTAERIGTRIVASAQFVAAASATILQSLKSRPLGRKYMNLIIFSAAISGSRIDSTLSTSTEASKPRPRTAPTIGRANTASPQATTRYTPTTRADSLIVNSRSIVVFPRSMATYPWIDYLC